MTTTTVLFPPSVALMILPARYASRSSIRTLVAVGAKPLRSWNEIT